MTLCQDILTSQTKRYVNWGEVKVTQSWPTLCKPMDYTSPWNFPGKNIDVGSLSLLQGMSPIQGSNPGFSHCRQILYQLSHHFIYHQEIQMVLNKLWNYAKIFSHPKYREINNTKKSQFIINKIWYHMRSADRYPRSNDEASSLNNFTTGSTNDL